MTPLGPTVSTIPTRPHETRSVRFAGREIGCLVFDRLTVTVAVAVLLTAGFLVTLADATALLNRAPADWAALGVAIAVTALVFPWVRAGCVRAVRHWRH